MTADPIARPRISVVVVVHDMARQAPRTLQALAPGYQQGISADEHEVVVVDSGSPVPLGEAGVRGPGAELRFFDPSLRRVDLNAGCRVPAEAPETYDALRDLARQGSGSRAR